MFRRECNRLITTRPRSAACRFQFAGFCGSDVSNQSTAKLQHPPPRYPKSPRPPLGLSSPRRNHHQCHHRLRRAVREYIRHASLAGDVLAVGSVSQLDDSAAKPFSSTAASARSRMRSLVSLSLRGVSCMSRSPAGTGDCTTGTLESVRDGGTRRARQRGHVDTTPIPNLQFVHRESSGRRLRLLQLLKMVLSKETRKGGPPCP